jgi:hypothetical protein
MLAPWDARMVTIAIDHMGKLRLRQSWSPCVASCSGQGKVSLTSGPVDSGAAPLTDAAAGLRGTVFALLIMG